MVVSLWNDLATSVGQELLDMADKSPVVAIKSLKVGEFQGIGINDHTYFIITMLIKQSHDQPLFYYSGVSLSALSKSIILVDPDTPEAKKLRSW